jgi:VWFA-related protein
MSMKMRFTLVAPTLKFPVLLVVFTLHVAGLSYRGRAQDTSVASSDASAAACQPADAERICITVEVADKSGRPVTGLQPSDFQLFDNKQAQKILAFHAVDASHRPAAPVQVEIIVDAVNASTALVAQERDGLSSFLEEQPGKLDYAASIGFLENSGLTPIAGPTSDRAELLTALKGAPSRLRVIRTGGGWGDDEKNHQATDLVKTMIASYANAPGRKLILFLSPGWPMLLNFEPDKRSWVFDDIVKITNGLRRSGVSLYALAPASFESTAYENFLKGVTKSGDAVYPDLALQVLAEQSGGQVIMDSNDIRGELDAALSGASAWYELVFERAPGGRENEYHALHVTVGKQAHVKIHTTAGYYVSAR